MKKSTVFYVLVLLFIAISLTSCDFDDSMLNPSNNENTNDIEDSDDSNDTKLYIKYDYDKSEISFNNPNCNSFVIEVNDDPYDESKCIWSSFGVKYEYSCNEEQFLVNVKAYKDDKLIVEESKIFYPLVIKNFSLDKETCIATFDDIEYAEGYEIYINNYKHDTIYEEIVNLDGIINLYSSSNLKIIPLSSKDGAVPVPFETSYTCQTELTSFHYNDALKRFEWYYDDNTDATFELVIGDEVIILENVGHYDCDITEPTSASIKQFAGSMVFDSPVHNIKLETDETTIAYVDYDIKTKILSWEAHENYSYLVNICEDDKKYSYEVEKNQLYFNALDVSDFVVEIIPNSHIHNRLHKASSFNIEIYDDVELDNVFDENANENTINIISDEESILKYNILIKKGTEELFNRDYQYEKQISFKDYQFLEDGYYRFICTPIYEEEDKVIVNKKDKYTLNFRRVNQLSNNYTYSNERGDVDIYFQQAEKIKYYSNGEWTQCSGNRYELSNSSSITNDEILSVSFYADYYYSKEYGSVTFPSYEPLEMTFTLLAPVKNVRINEDKIEWDYSGNMTKYLITLDDKDYYTSNNYFIPTVEVGKSHSISITPVYESSKFVLAPSVRWLYVDKLKETIIDKVDLISEELIVTARKVENALGYEFLLDDVLYSSASNVCSLPIGNASTLKVRTVGDSNTFSSNYSLDYNLKYIADSTKLINSNKTRTISFTVGTAYLDTCDFLCQIYSNDTKCYHANYVPDKISVSGYECGTYHLTLESSTEMSGYDIYVGGQLLEYDFSIIDFDIEVGQYEFNNVYYPASLVNSDIYKYYMSFRFETGVAGMIADYTLDYKDKVMPELRGIYDDYAEHSTVYFDFVDATSDECYETYNIFTKRDSVSKWFYVIEVSEKGTIKYSYSHSDEIWININDISAKNIVYTITKNGSEYMETTEDHFALDAFNTAVTYDVYVKNQIVDNTFYVGTKFSKYEVKNTVRNITQEYTKAPSLRKAEIYTVSYDETWIFTEAAYYDIVLDNFVIEHPYSDDLVYYAYAHLYIVDPDGTIKNKGIYTEIYNRTGKFDFGEIILTSGTKLIFEFFISPDGYNIPSDVVICEYYAL